MRAMVKKVRQTTTRSQDKEYWILHDSPCLLAKDGNEARAVNARAGRMKSRTVKF